MRSRHGFKLDGEKRNDKEGKKSRFRGKYRAHSPVNLIPQDADVVVAHAGLSKRAKEVAVNSVVISFNMFMNDPAINKLIADLTAGNDITSA